MAGYKPYPSYLAEGTPADWKRKRLRFALKMNPSKSEVRLQDDEQVSFVPMDAVGEYGGIRLSEEKELGEIGGGYTYFCDDDVVVAKITPCFENGKGALARGLKNRTAFGTTELHVLRADRAQLEPDFLFFLTISDLFRKLGESEMYGAGGQKRVPENFFKDFRAALPSIDEQQAIARFLDFKTAQIDALIAKKKSLLEKLAEKRTALISHAVTKGLDPSVPMKDSGVEWIGETPQHWTTRRVKFAAKLESGHTPSKQVPEYWEDCDIPWVSLNDSKKLAIADYIAETAIQINSLGLANSSARLLPENAVVFTRDATIGLCAITTRPMAVSQHLIAWIPGPDITPLYLLRVFNAMRGFLDSFTFGATIKTIGMPDVKKLTMPIPPKNEQDAITKYIGHQFQATQPQIRATEMAIAKLQEYRSAIITSAVTGKIDVRNVSTPPVALAGA